MSPGVYKYHIDKISATVRGVRAVEVNMFSEIAMYGLGLYKQKILF